jgi:hypothetical protein
MTRWKAMIFGAVTAFTVLTVFWGTEARACDYTCQIQVQATMGGSLSGFYGSSFMGGGQMYGMGGQMGYYGGMTYPMYVANAIRWNGTQPLGFSYMPPMGLQLMQNHQIYDQVFSGGGY